MLPYWLLFVVYASGALLFRPTPDRQVQGGPLFLAAGIAATLMIGLRYEVGGDWPRYVQVIDLASRLDFGDALKLEDPGYAFVNWAAAQIGAGLWLVDLVCAMIFMWGVARLARQQTNPWLVVTVAVPYLLIAVAMGYTRQAVAIGLVMAGLTTLERGIVRFVLYLGFAVLFHKSALAVLPLVALSSQRRPIVTAAILLASAVLLYYLFVQASVDKLMNNYVESGYSSQGAALRIAMNLPPAVLYFLFKRRFGLPPQQQRLWRNFSVAALGTAIVLTLTTSTTAVDRLALYLIPLQMVVLARMPDAFPEDGRRDIKLVILVVAYSAIIQFVWLNYADNVEAWLPYRAYLFDSDLR